MNKLAEIRSYNIEEFAVGFIIEKTQDYIVSKQIGRYGQYDGYTFESLKPISRIVYRSKYLDFMKKILKNDNSNYAIVNKEDMILNALKYNKLLTLSCKGWSIFINVRVISFDNNILKCQRINKYGEFKQDYNINVTSIDIMTFDSRLLRMYERIISTKWKNWQK